MTFWTYNFIIEKLLLTMLDTVKLIFLKKSLTLREGSRGCMSITSHTVFRNTISERK